MTPAGSNSRVLADRIWDALVIGAGPAGALAARQLAQRGCAVLLVDRATFPRAKVCGCCLNGRALTTLAAVGLKGVVDACGAVPLDGFRLAAGGRTVTLPLAGSVALSRRRLDAALVNAAVQAGAVLQTGVQARLGPCHGPTRHVYLRHNGHEVTAAAQCIIAANGLGGNLLASEVLHVTHRHSRLGAGTVLADAPAVYTPGTVFMACGMGGYVGLVRLEDGQLDVAAAFDPAYVSAAGGLGAAAEAILHQAGLPPIPGLAEQPWRGTPLLTRRLRQPAGVRVLAVGDAAGYVEPFTGEGIGWALTSGAAVAELWSRPEAERAPEWTRWYRRSVARNQRLCRLVAAALRRPRLMRLAVEVLDRLPMLASPILRSVQGAQRRWHGISIAR